jgi:hypothetical protein
MYLITHVHTTVALDQNIVATALPVISSYFNALDSVTWIVSAHFLTVGSKRHFMCLPATHAIYSTPASQLITDDWPTAHHRAHKMDLSLRHCTLRNRVRALCRGAEHELSVIV